MPNIDSLSKAFFSDSYIFADAINGHFFDGEQVVIPESLSDMDSAEIVLPEKSVVNVSQEYRRDLLKLLTCKRNDNTTYAILGIEEQTRVDYSMPIRTWLYDAMTYNREVRAFANYNKIHKKEEANRFFTSKLLPGVRVNAVISL